MSTIYKTVPLIPYEEFLDRVKSLTIVNPTQKVYNVPHKFLRGKDSGVYVYKGENGEALFERYGINKVENVFPQIINEFGFTIYDEFGLKWPEES